MSQDGIITIQQYLLDILQTDFYKSITYRIELLLKFLICVVDTKLLKAIYFECFKPVNIKNTDELMFFILILWF